jgi:hypothetical protein
MDSCENCKTCEHSVFDEQWGEYKCKERETHIYILLNSSECPKYAKKKGDNSK